MSQPACLYGKGECVMCTWSTNSPLPETRPWSWVCSGNQPKGPGGTVHQLRGELTRRLRRLCAAVYLVHQQKLKTKADQIANWKDKGVIIASFFIWWTHPCEAYVTPFYSRWIQSQLAQDVSLTAALWKWRRRWKEREGDRREGSGFEAAVLQVLCSRLDDLLNQVRVGGVRIRRSWLSSKRGVKDAIPAAANRWSSARDRWWEICKATWGGRLKLDFSVNPSSLFI